MIVCDLCGQSKVCVQKEIDGREYDICTDCWNALAEKLRGKGRVKKDREAVFLPPLKKDPKSQNRNQCREGHQRSTVVSTGHINCCSRQRSCGRRIYWCA